MAVFLKKWVKWCKTAQVVLAVEYLIVTLIIPLSHSCNSGEAYSEHSHSSNSNYHCCGESSINPALDIAPKQNKCESESLRHQIYCAACLYSNVFKSAYENAGATLINIEVSTSFQVSPLSRAIKHSEWFSSVHSRGPPAITS